MLETVFQYSQYFCLLSLLHRDCRCLNDLRARTKCEQSLLCNLDAPKVHKVSQLYTVDTKLGDFGFNVGFI